MIFSFLYNEEIPIFMRMRKREKGRELRERERDRKKIPSISEERVICTIYINTFDV